MSTSENSAAQPAAQPAAELAALLADLEKQRKAAISAALAAAAEEEEKARAATERARGIRAQVATADAQRFESVTHVVGSAPRNGPVTASVWSQPQVPHGIAAARTTSAQTAARTTTAQSTAAAAAAAAPPATDSRTEKLLGEVVTNLGNKVCQVKITNNNNLVITFGYGCNRTKMLIELSKVFGLSKVAPDRFEKHDDDACVIALNSIRKVASAACGMDHAPTNKELENAVTFFVTACYCWGYDSCITNLELPTALAKHFGVVRLDMNPATKAIRDRLKPNDTDALLEGVIENLAEVSNIGSYSGGGASAAPNNRGGGASAATNNSSRSVSQARAASTGPEFKPDDALAELIDRNSYTVGAINSPAAGRLRKAFADNQLVRYGDGLVQGHNGSTLKPSDIESIICKALNTQTTAQAVAKKNADEAKARRAAELAAELEAQKAGIGAVPEGATSSSEDEDEAGDEANTGAEDGNGAEADGHVYELPGKLYNLITNLGADTANTIYANVSAKFGLRINNDKIASTDGGEIDEAKWKSILKEFSAEVVAAVSGMYEQ